MEHDQLDLHDRASRRPTPKSPVGGPSGGLLGLQQSAGNAAVSSMLAQRIPIRMDEMDASSGGSGAATPESAGVPASTGDTSASEAGGATGDAGASAAGGGGINDLGPIARAGTLIADSIIASSYTPGAGNIM
jgi:hypothetical protein